MPAPLEVTEERKQQVARLAAIGMTQEQAAQIMGFSVDTLARHYSEVWHEARARATESVAAGVLQRAVGGDNACSFFYLTKLGGPQFRDKQDLKVAGALQHDVKGSPFMDKLLDALSGVHKSK